MTKVILQPASGPAASEHYDKTIAKTVPLSRATPDILSDDILLQLQAIYGDRGFRVWGAIPGAKNDESYAVMEPGDIVLFYQRGRFVSSLVVTLKAPGASALARELWGLNDAGATWEHVFFLDDFRPVDISYEDVWDVIQFGPRDRLMGLTVLGETLSRQVVERFQLGGADPGDSERRAAVAPAGESSEHSAEPFIVLRRLTGSELGWFAEPRDLGKARGRQRGINFNAAEMERIFSGDTLAAGDIPVVSRRLSDGQTQTRPIRLQEKNWRLVGDKVSGSGLELLEAGDFFWAEIDPRGEPPYQLLWDVVTRTAEPDLHARIDREFSVFLDTGMASWPTSDQLSHYLGGLVGLYAAEASTTRDAPEVHENRGADKPSVTPPPLDRARAEVTPPSRMTTKRKRIEDRLHRPHILAEILKSGLVLSAKAQTDFIDVLDTISAQIRDLFLEAGLIQKVEINHSKAWAAFKGIPIGFVDGGMANVAALGAAPVAIRVGSYVVTPGDRGPEREAFDFEIQLVDDLYESAGKGTGIFEDMFEDVAKLRDAARMCCEVGGMLSLLVHQKPPEIVLVHGPLVNPVSPYALEGFPNFAQGTIAKLLPGESKPRAGHDANFVVVYSDQLKRLQKSSATVCGVVERPSISAPGPLVRALVEQMQSDGRIDATARREFLDKLEGYRITDSVLFECVLDEGEYVTPTELDKQGPDNKIPEAWHYEIKSYPKPFVTYVKSSVETMPVRVESFAAGPLTHPQLMMLVVHTSRLLPKYSFPVGLDIVDKHAKVPEWMSRQMSAMLSAQLMRKAMDTGNPAAVRLVRRILSANSRDWLFRPDFRKG